MQNITISLTPIERLFLIRVLIIYLHTLDARSGDATNAAERSRTCKLMEQLGFQNVGQQ